MSVSSIDTKIAPARRGRDSHLTPADTALIVAWAALTVILVAYAIAEGSIGAIVLAVLTTLQAWNAWRGAAQRDDSSQLRFD
jgi:hypothetical protein